MNATKVVNAEKCTKQIHTFFQNSPNAPQKYLPFGIKRDRICCAFASFLTKVCGEIVAYTLPKAVIMIE